MGMGDWFDAIGDVNWKTDEFPIADCCLLNGHCVCSQPWEQCKYIYFVEDQASTTHVVLKSSDV